MNSARAAVEKVLPLLLVLLVPLLVLTGDRSLIFNHPGYLDPWIYYALYYNLATLTTLFPAAYYPSRLSLVLPGYVVHHVFSPVIANYVLHLLIWLAAVAGLYVVVKQVAGRRSAMVAATVFGFCPYVWRAVGWDYPDGIGNAYYLLTMAFLTLAAAYDAAARRYLVLAGITCAGAVYCNLTWAFLVPTFGPYWFLVRKARGYPLSLGRTLLYSAAGFLLLSLVLAIVNYKVSGFYLFYLPSILYAINGIQGPSTYAAPDNRWILTSPWLYLPMAAVAAGLFSLVHFRWRRSDVRARMVVTLYVNLLCCAGVLVAWELAGQPLLQIPYYASYLLAPTFLFLGVAAFQVPETLPTGRFYLLLAAVIAACSWVWWDPTGVTWQWLVRPSWTPLVVLAIAAVVAGAAFEGRTIAVSVAVLGASLLALNARTAGLWWEGRSAAETEAAYRRIVEGIEIGISAAPPAGMIRFWYDDADRHGDEFNSINSSYLWGPTKVSAQYPNPPQTPTLGLTAILSSLPDRERSATFVKAQESLRRIGFGAHVVADHVIDRGGVRYGMTIVNLELDMAAVRAYGYIRNGDFESGSESWVTGSAKARAVEGGHSGKALALEPETGTGQYLMQWNFARLERGKKYKLVVWTRSGGASPEPFVVGVWDNAASRYVASRRGDTSMQWERQEVEFTNDSDNLLSVELMKNSPSKNPILFDSVSLTEVQ